MINFIFQNLGTIIVSILLAAALFFAMRKIYKDKKAGRSSCGYKCSGCPGSSVCNGGIETNDLKKR